MLAVFTTTMPSSSRCVWVYHSSLRAIGTLYVGHTADILRRERDHNEGRGGRYHRLVDDPLRMVYSERHVTLESACARERTAETVDDRLRSGL